MKTNDFVSRYLVSGFDIGRYRSVRAFWFLNQSPSFVTRTEKGRSIEHLLLELFHIEVNYGRDVQRNELRDNQAANNNQSQRPSRGTIGSVAERDWECTKHGGECSH